MLNQQDRELLEKAVALGSSESFIMKINNKVGKKIDEFTDKINVSEEVSKATNVAMEKALDMALYTMDLSENNDNGSKLGHKVMTGALGFAGGLFGAAGLIAELPVTVTLMLRSIAAIAKEHGEDLTSTEAKLNCVAVFGLVSGNDEEHNFFSSRKDINKSVDETLGYLGVNLTGKVGVPVLSKAMGAVFKKFGVTVAEKVTAQSLPIVGAIGGAAINTLFTDYYQDMAEAHFTIRQLERTYGAEAVDEAIKDIIKKEADSEKIKKEAKEEIVVIIEEKKAEKKEAKEHKKKNKEKGDK